MATATLLQPDSQPRERAEPTAFRVVSSAAELGTLADAWRALDDGVESPMQTFAWIAACAETFAPPGELDVLVGERDGKIVAAAPLLAVAGNPGRRRELLNYHRVYEPADFAFRDAESLAALAVALRKRGRPMLLERVFAASPTTAALTRALAGMGRVVIRPQAATPFMTLDETWAAPEQKLSSRRRGDFRRAWKNAEQLGKVRVDCHAPGPDDIDRLLDLAFDIERQSWKGAAGTALADSLSGEFYRRYARSVAGQGRFRVELLRLGDESAAMQLGVIHQNRYWVLKVGYDPRFQRASPGILLMVEAIKAAVAERRTTYELLGAVEPWIEVWTEQQRACVSLRYYPANWRGAAALCGDVRANVRRRLARNATCQN